MPIIHPAVRTFFRLNGALIPAAATELAFRAFKSTGRPAEVKDPERAVHGQSVSELRRIGTHTVRVYTWLPTQPSHSGEIASSHLNATPTVLLLHGWRSRTSRFARLIEQFTSQGYRVVGFDAPGHGDSPNGSPSAADIVAIAQGLEESFGPWQAIVGHSFGALAAHTLARSSKHSVRVVAIGGATSARFLRDTFMRAIDLPLHLKDQFTTRIVRGYPLPEGTLFTEFDEAIRPPSTNTRLLIVHDSKDREVPLTEARQLHLDRPTNSELLITDGLGHNRILHDPEVVERIVDFVAEPILL
ncbi:alpha/beta hydrolase [Leucobacter viscericola]|uniref:Alpha/beta hydrolase n=1 Tax=Leucobacter viscericola TaxID=2714935 RepID=A0A6G7XEK3_9MICO|nr:alpha/beta hydrolase [Leucobacter viscericola]QIK62801.1 alpha/beta hydrolase [Leucobacter viscericola]